MIHFNDFPLNGVIPYILQEPLVDFLVKAGILQHAEQKCTPMQSVLDTTNIRKDSAFGQHVAHRILPSTQVPADIRKVVQCKQARRHGYSEREDDMVRHKKVKDRLPHGDGKWLNQPSIIFRWQLQIATNRRRSTRVGTRHTRTRPYHQDGRSSCNQDHLAQSRSEDRDYRHVGV